MSVFTHLLPGDMRHYLREISRILKADGTCVLSLFLPDYYRPGERRPTHFAADQFSFDHQVPGTDGQVKTSDPDCPETMLAVEWSFLREIASDAGLLVLREQLPGLWSGSQPHWVTGQDVVVLARR